MRTIKQLLMMVALLLCSVTSNAYDFEVNGIYYNIISISDLTVEVTNGDNKYSGAVIIPSTITYKAKTLSVISIGYSAFKNCYGLISCVIGNNVTNIKQYAFDGCSNLTSVTIGENVANIGNAAFSGCTSLEEVHISNLSAWCNIEFDTYAPGPHAEKLYLNGELVTDLVIPDDITTIKESSFSYCKSLTSVKISNSVTSIECQAFEGCSNLTSVIIGENVANIEYNAFAYCTSLKYLHIENGTEMLCLGVSLFVDCPLETLYIGRNLDYNTSSNRGYSPFYNKKTLKSVIIGNSVTSIKTNAFKNCDMITGIYLLGTEPPAVGNNNFTNSQYMNLTVYVPKGSLATYQSADVWKNFWDIREEGKENPGAEVKKCATPTISYEGGKLDITSETEGVEFVTEITNSDITKHYTSMIELAVTYNVSTYAKLSGYENSDVTYATLCWIESDDAGSDLTQIKSTPVLIKSNEGSISISGVKANTEITVYDINGNKVSAAVADGNEVVVNTSLSKNETAIIHIGDKAIKIIMR